VRGGCTRSVSRLSDFSVDDIDAAMRRSVSVTHDCFSDTVLNE
jgi:hypothetical protein